jgi:nucleoside-diphosphate-sugar epimerase
VSVAEIVELVGELLGRHLEVEVEDARLRPPPSEVERLQSDPQLARQLIGWRPAVDLRTGLAATIEWIRSNSQRYRAGEYAR